MEAFLVDIGGTKIKIVQLSNIDNTMKTFNTPKTSTEIVDTIVNYVEELRNTKDKSTEDIVIVGCPGLINKNGIVEKVLYVPLAGFNLKSTLSERLKCNIILENDANLEALGFANEELLYISIGTGVGGAFIYKGLPLRGHSNFACEFGHLYVNTGKKCRCGREGCLDTVLSGNYFLNKFGTGWWNCEDNSEINDCIKFAGVKCGQAISQLAILYNPNEIVVAGKICLKHLFKVTVLENYNKNAWEPILDIRFESEDFTGMINGAKKIIALGEAYGL